MATEIDQAKNTIRLLLKSKPKVETPLGDLIISTGKDNELGSGGNAIVYAGVWGHGNVAVKFLAIDCSGKLPSKYQRFIAEFRELVKLANTGAVVSVYYFGFLKSEQGNFPYIVMEKCQSTLMKYWSKENPTKDLSKVLPIFRRLLDCLSIVHEHGIIHRDIKPENILLTQEDKFVLGDFGIAWFDPSHYERLAKTDKGERLANYGFSAPEQFPPRGETHPTMDLYALGQVMQWLVTGRTHHGTGRRSLADIDPSLKPLDPIINRLLQQEPNKRPQTAEEVMRMLNEELKHSRKISEIEAEEKYIRSKYEAMEQFHERLRSALPARQGLIRVTDKEKIDQLLTTLSANLDEYGPQGTLWWTQGTSDNHILKGSFRKISEDLWLINFMEYRVEEAWVKRNLYSPHREYVLLQCGPLLPFQINGREYYEAYWYKDRYLTPDEGNDGQAIIDGQTVQLSGESEYRMRNSEREFIFIVVFGHSIQAHHYAVERIYQSLKLANQVEPSLLEPIENFTHATP